VSVGTPLKGCPELSLGENSPVGGEEMEQVGHGWAEGRLKGLGKELERLGRQCQAETAGNCGRFAESAPQSTLLSYVGCV